VTSPHYQVTFAEQALAGVKALDRPQDIAALTEARDALSRHPRAGVLQADGLFRLHVAVDNDPQRISILYRLLGDEVRIVWILVGP
jgi:hypothetical protein